MIICDTENLNSIRRMMFELKLKVSDYRIMSGLRVIVEDEAVYIQGLFWNKPRWDAHNEDIYLLPLGTKINKKAYYHHIFDLWKVISWCYFSNVTLQYKGCMYYAVDRWVIVYEKGSLASPKESRFIGWPPWSCLKLSQRGNQVKVANLVQAVSPYQTSFCCN